GESAGGCLEGAGSIQDSAATADSAETGSEGRVRQKDAGRGRSRETGEICRGATGLPRRLAVRTGRRLRGCGGKEGGVFTAHGRRETGAGREEIRRRHP